MNDPFFGTSGPRDAKIAFVGEAWGSEELAQKVPFVGQAGQELSRMCSEAGIDFSSCFKTNVVAARPEGNDMWKFFHPAKEAPAPALRGLHPLPIVEEGLKNLYAQLDMVRPQVIVACGNYPLWALTHQAGYSTKRETGGRRTPSGIMDWRGSQWWAEAAPGSLAQTRLVPIIHPATILRAWYNRACTVHDLRIRVAQRAFESGWRPLDRTVLAPPTFEQAVWVLRGWLSRMEWGETLRLVNDIETARNLITCIGFSDSKDFGMCIPFIRREGKGFDSFYSFEEERELLSLMRQVLTHPNVRVEGQNYLYDMQYIARDMFCIPRLSFDSMLAYHLLYPGTPKALDYQSSLFCKHHWFWKEDHKEWNMSGTIEDLLVYNCEDLMRNFEINDTLRVLIPQMGLEEQWKEELEKNWLAFDMMQRGMKIDTKHRGVLAFNLAGVSADLSRWFTSIVPQHIASPDAKKDAAPWFRSEKQLKRFLQEDLGLHLPVSRKTDSVTIGSEALTTLREKYPEYRRLWDHLELLRSVGVFHNNFIKAELGPGDRIKCMFNTSGTETFRWSSSTDAFGRGTNLQNIPKGEED